MKLALALSCAVALCGCAPKMFVHPNPAAVNNTADMAQCEYEIEMAERGVRVPWWYNNRQTAGYLIGAAIGQAIRNDRLRTLCMTAKGYTAVPLQGAPVPIGQPQPGLIGVAPPPEYAPSPTVMFPAPTAVPVAVPPVSAAPQVAVGIKAESKYQFTAEGIAKAQGCNPPMAAMTSKGAGMELFAIACPSGITLAIRCEVDGCRVLR